MALVPTPSTNSTVDLALGNVPLNVEDPQILYIELSDIHSAIESLQTALTDTSSEDARLYVAKQRFVVLAATASFIVLDTHGLILLDSTSNSVNCLLPLAADGVGYKYSFKCIDATNTCTVTPAGVETIDSDTGSFELFLDEVIEVQSDGTEWWIR